MSGQSVDEKDANRPDSFASTSTSQTGDTKPGLSLHKVDLSVTRDATVLSGQDITFDLEKGAKVDEDSSEEPKDEQPIPRARVDSNLVTWDGPDDPENPRNWPIQRKWIVAWVVSLFTLMR